ncbi:hypothetical protein KAX75_04000 [candidate division WOR-3 bacterium]|nr:hypothetical protein [candidate division WOR-3 bacterium]
MKQILNYNIHDILKFQIVRDSKYSFRDINRIFSCFQVDEIDKPDIILNIGRFTPSNEDCYLIDYKYHIRENYFYCRDSGRNAKWEVEIIGFEQGGTIINFDVTTRFRPQPIASLVSLPISLPRTLLLRIIGYKLCQEGYFLIHSAAISRDDRAYLLCSRGGAFKTTLCMDFVRRAGFGVFGDDMVILHNDKVLSFPMASSIFQFMTTHLPTEKHWGFFRQVQFAVEQFLNKPQKTAMQGDRFAKLEALLFVTRSNRKQGGKQVTIEKFSYRYLEQAVNRILANNRAEGFKELPLFGIDSLPFLKYELVYNFVFPNSLTATYEKKFAENLRDILKKIPIYKIDTPFNYSLEAFEEINKFVMDCFES